LTVAAGGDRLARGRRLTIGLLTHGAGDPNNQCSDLGRPAPGS